MPPDPLMPALRAKRPVHPMLMSAAVTCFIGTLATDLAYWRSADVMWTDFSNWLVSAGVVIACLAAVAAVYDHVDTRVRPAARTWPYLLGLAALLVVAVFNMLIHTRDAWTSVVPWGLTLSVAVVVIALVTGWVGRVMIYRSVGEVRA